MKKILMLLSVFCLSFSSAAAQAANVTGFWQTFYEKTGKPKSIVRVYEINGLIYGEITVTFREDGAPNIVKDENGEVVGDKSVRAEKIKGKPPFCGLIVLKNLRHNNRGVYRGGALLNPESGKSYNAEIWLANDGNLKIKGKWGVFSRTMTAIPITEEQLKSVFTL